MKGNGGAHVKYKKSVYRSLALITQFGINMLVPIFLCTMIGVYIGEKYSINWITIPLFGVGALAGFRNIFIMAKKVYSVTDKREMDETSVEKEKNHISKASAEKEKS